MPEDRKDRREKMAKEAKTNAMRMLDRQKVKYDAFSYECDEFIDGIHSADKIGAPYDQSFKTLVMEGKSGGYFVFVVPIEKEVDRKAAAKAVGEKTVDMIHEGYHKDYRICERRLQSAGNEETLSCCV